MESIPLQCNDSDDRGCSSSISWTAPLSDSALAQISAKLHADHVMVLPTETVYGLAALWSRPQAVRRIYELKGRPLHHPLIAHLPARWGSLDYLHQVGWVDGQKFTPPQQQAIEKLMQRIWPGPCTLLLPHPGHNPLPYAQHLPALAVRVPSHPVVQAILTHLDEPLLMPSANPFGLLSPTTLQLARKGFSPHPMLGVEGGLCSVGIESTIVAVPTREQPVWRLLRRGGTTQEQLEAWLQQPLQDEATQCYQRGAQVPGQLAKHYAPSTPMALYLPQWDQAMAYHLTSPLRLPPLLEAPLLQGKRICLLLLQDHAWIVDWFKQHHSHLDVHVLVYGAPHDGSGAQTAQQLYANLAAADSQQADLMLVEYPMSSHDFWPAIQDRLARAATAGYFSPPKLH